jgi:hypothetical protein
MVSRQAARHQVKSRIIINMKYPILLNTEKIKLSKYQRETVMYGGNYFVTAQLRYTYGCREEFAKYGFHANSKYFYYKSQNIQSIMEFMATIERKLNLAEKDRITFQLTDDQSLIKIFVSSWWKNGAVRRQFLTAVIKSAAISKTKINLRNMFKQSAYFGYNNFIKEATERFLSGYTKVNKGYSGGWVNTFYREGKHLILEKE